MKKQTKIKITAVAAGFALATLFGAAVLVVIAHPAQWAVATVSVLAIGISIFTACTID